MAMRIQAILKSIKRSHNPRPSPLLKWEDAGEKLASALSAYLQSCIFLNASSDQGPDKGILASRIDHSLNNLHAKLSDELSWSRVLLSQMRNKISSRSYSLPNEVLTQIFMDVVYTPSPGDGRFPSMTDAIKRIFRRLHSLLAVCSTWRNVGIALGELWSVIPVADGKSNYISPNATTLVIQRSQALVSSHRRLHLAVVLGERFAPVPPFVQGQVPQFYSINIEARHMSPTYDISRLLEELLASQSPAVFSELSIRQYQDKSENAPSRIPNPNEYIGCHMSTQHRDLFTGLIGSLYLSTEEC